MDAAVVESWARAYRYDPRARKWSQSTRIHARLGALQPAVVEIDKDAVEGLAEPVPHFFDRCGIGINVADVHVSATGQRTRGQDVSLPVWADDR